MFSGHKSDRKNESCKGWKNSWPGNHTAAEFGRHLWKSSSPKLYSEQAQLNQVAQGHEHHQWWSLHDTYGQPALVPDSPHSVIKKGGFLLLQFEALPLALSLTIPERSLSASFTLKRFPKPSLLYSVQSQLGQPLLINRYSKHLIVVALGWTPWRASTSWTEEPRSGHSLVEEALTSWQSSANTDPNQGWLTVNPEPFAQSCFPAAWPCSLCRCMGWGARQGPGFPQPL